MRFRAIWISDLHLGTPVARRRTSWTSFAVPNRITYLVGDIVDGWQLRRRWYWAQTDNDVVQKALCLKLRITNAVSYICDFERAVVAEARRRAAGRGPGAPDARRAPLPSAAA